MAALGPASAIAVSDPAPYVRRDGAGEASLDLLITGAHCANCIARIEKAVGGLDGVTSARLNLSTGKLSVHWQDGALAPFDLSRTVSALGFGVRPYVADSALDQREDERKFLLRCLAVAGFGAVFVVGLADAIYYSTDFSPVTRTFFNWLGAIVAAPVTLYAGRPFFRSALTALKVRRGNMDLPISLSLILTLFLSFYQTSIGGGQVYFDAAVMLCFLLLVGRFLDFQLRNRARGAAAELLTMQAGVANRILPSGETSVVAVRDLMPGHHIFLRSGERAPVDGTVAGTTEADLSLVTGESVPVALKDGETLYAGAVITGAPVRVAVTAPAENSLIAELARILEAGQQNRNRYVRLADKAASLYVPVVHSLSLAVFLVWLFFAPFTVAMTNAIAILIVTCPCALGLAVPAVQIVASSRLFRRGILIKTGDALERLAEVNFAVFDKTGTLTVGRPQWIADPQISQSVLEDAAQLARASRHPLAMALAAAAGNGPVAAGAVEIPGNGVVCDMDGTDRRLGRADWVGVNAENDGSSELWYRTGQLPPIRFAFTDAVRSDAAATIAALKEHGIDALMVSGDRNDVASRVAHAVGLGAWHAEVDPKSKVEILKGLRNQGMKALMVGDGLNDAAALANAHVSISPASAIDAAQMASDMVLRTRGLAPIVEAVIVARRARRLVFENLAFSALYNAVAIPVAALGFVTPFIAALAMATSSLVVTLNALRAATGGK